LIGVTETVLNFSLIMAEDKSKDAGIQEFKLEPDTELRFEVEVPETKNDKVVLEVCISTLSKKCYHLHLTPY
jgi:hypothetical protein